MPGPPRASRAERPFDLDLEKKGRREPSVTATGESSSGPPLGAPVVVLVQPAPSVTTGLRGVQPILPRPAQGPLPVTRRGRLPVPTVRSGTGPPRVLRRWWGTVPVTPSPDHLPHPPVPFTPESTSSRRIILGVDHTGHPFREKKGVCINTLYQSLETPSVIETDTLSDLYTKELQERKILEV